MMSIRYFYVFFFFFQAEDGIRDLTVTGVQTCALPISRDNPAGVLGPEGALQGRLAEVSKLRQHADHGAQHERLDAPQAGEEDQAADRRDHHRAGERAERALDRLARADRGGEWVAAEGAAGEVATRGRSHRRVDGE